MVIVSALSSFFRLHLPPLSPARLQPFTFVSQLLCPAVLYICLPALGCVSLAILYIVIVSLCLHLSPSSGLAILYICLAALGCCVRLYLAILNFTCVSQL